MYDDHDLGENDAGKHFAHQAQSQVCSGSEAGSYLRLIDSCVTQLKAQGHSRTCNESKEEVQTLPDSLNPRGTRPASTSIPEHERICCIFQGFQYLR